MFLVEYEYFNRIRFHEPKKNAALVDLIWRMNSRLNTLVFPIENAILKVLFGFHFAPPPRVFTRFDFKKKVKNCESAKFNVIK